MRHQWTSLAEITLPISRSLVPIFKDIPRSSFRLNTCNKNKNTKSHHPHTKCLQSHFHPIYITQISKNKPFSSILSLSKKKAKVPHHGIPWPSPWWRDWCVDVAAVPPFPRLAHQNSENLQRCAGRFGHLIRSERQGLLETKTEALKKTREDKKNRSGNRNDTPRLFESQKTKDIYIPKAVTLLPPKWCHSLKE